jgi:hypothetical protein
MYWREAKKPRVSSEQSESQAGGVAQMVGHLPSQRGALSLNPSIAKNKQTKPGIPWNIAYPYSKFYPWNVG